MTEKELRIGSIINYQTAEGDILPATIDWQDIKWISEDEKGFNLCHSPITLTEEWLLKLGFYTHGKYKWHGNGYDYQPKDHWQERTDYILNDDFFIAAKEEYFNSELDSSSMIVHNTEWYERCFENAIYAPIKYVHELQNLYFALTGEELEVKL